MDKHTRIIIVFFVTMLLASLVTFSILYLLPLVSSGNSPPILSAPASLAITAGRFTHRRVPLSYSPDRFCSSEIRAVDKAAELYRYQRGAGIVLI